MMLSSCGSCLCQVVWYFFILHRVGVYGQSTSGENCTTCVRARFQAAVGLIVSPTTPQHVPSCSEDGSWQLVQCIDGYGLCWCVDNVKEGQRSINTTTRGATPDCQKGYGNVNDVVCLDGSQVWQCPPNLCQLYTCPKSPDAVCRVNPCGACRVEFYDYNNQIVECEEGLTTCQKDRSQDWRQKMQPHLTPLTQLMGMAILYDLGQRFNSLTEITSCFGIETVNVIDPQVFNKPSHHFMNSSKEQATAYIRDKIQNRENSEIELVEMLYHFQLSGLHLRLIEPKTLQFNWELVEELFEPVQNVSHGMQGIYVPTCDQTTGAYETKQCQQDWCWCVNQAGIVTPNTVTNLELQCDSRGQPLGTVSLCPKDQKPARSCERVCSNTPPCRKNPFATCMTHPCDDCQVTWEAISEKHCDKEENHNKGWMNWVIRGALGLPREKVMLNNKTCESPNTGNICSLPSAQGYCRAYFQMWFYNWTAKRCEEFIYGGCRGNENRFSSAQECHKKCGVSMCSNPNHQPTICSNVCSVSSQICDKYPEAVCVPDPCKCTPVYYDIRTHKPISCTASIEPLCHRHQARQAVAQFLSHGVDISFVQCNWIGRYKYTQCSTFMDKCWCVDDRGIRLPGSDFDKEEPIDIGSEKTVKDKCVVNKTKTTQFQFTLHPAIEFERSEIYLSPEICYSEIADYVNTSLDGYYGLGSRIVAALSVTSDGGYPYKVHLELASKEDHVDLASVAEYLKSKVISGNFIVSCYHAQFIGVPASVKAKYYYEELRLNVENSGPIEEPEDLVLPGRQSLVLPLGITVGVITAGCLVLIIVWLKMKQMKKMKENDSRSSASHLPKKVKLSVEPLSSRSV